MSRADGWLRLRSNTPEPLATHGKFYRAKTTRRHPRAPVAIPTPGPAKDIQIPPKGLSVTQFPSPLFKFQRRTSVLYRGFEVSQPIATRYSFYSKKSTRGHLRTLTHQAYPSARRYSHFPWIYYNLWTPLGRFLLLFPKLLMLQFVFMYWKSVVHVLRPGAPPPPCLYWISVVHGI